MIIPVPDDCLCKIFIQCGTQAVTGSNVFPPLPTNNRFLAFEGSEISPKIDEINSDIDTFPIRDGFWMLEPSKRVFIDF